MTMSIRNIFLFTFSLSAFTVIGACGQQSANQQHQQNLTQSAVDTTKHKYTNHLASESSPYLLMHAHNPVDWYPWGDEALTKAKLENKLLIISVGYAACHWCHVMEHESFENEEVAQLMNAHFVSVKVDREERPDVDQVYMNACQLISGNGGWPLNVVALPDGRPIYAGTYFPKDNWMSLLQQIHTFYVQTPEKALEQAQQVTEGIKGSEIVNLKSGTPSSTIGDLKQSAIGYHGNIDHDMGGFNRAPKFPLPAGWSYLLTHYYHTGDKKSLDAVTVTLDRMAWGGINDQVGGGFARYSVDSEWKVPHFEKMLYDNAQLVSLYAHAYRLTKNELYKTTITQITEFLERELMSPEGAFYSSLDADSEGEEGRFYVWTKKEFDKVVGADAALLAAYYRVTEAGNWEHGNNVLIRYKSDADFARAQKITLAELQKKVAKARPALLAARAARVRPPLDDKILTAWNALMITGYADAYRALGNKEMLAQALRTGNFMKSKMMSADGRLNRNYKNGKSTINAYLDDYALTIEAFINLYQITFDEQWLTHAHTLADYTDAHFYDATSGMYFYTSNLDPALIARKMEITDNVIPGSNSVMAQCFYKLGTYLYKPAMIDRAAQMLHNVKDKAVAGGPYYAGWQQLIAYFASTPFEVAIVGPQSQAVRAKIEQQFMPDVFVLGGVAEGSLELLEGKLQPGRTMIYVCRNKTCKLPVTDPDEALKQIKNYKLK